MSIFDELAKKQQRTPFPSSNEENFFLENTFRLNSSDLWRPFQKPADSFQTVRANIIIRALINKESIEREYLAKTKADKENEGKDIDSLSLADYMSGILSGLPYLSNEQTKIYVPIFPESVNILYSKSWSKLLIPPYKNIIRDYQAITVDPFDYYGYRIYDSYFTRLVPIRKTAKILACYDYDAEAIYFINDQGRLDAKVCLFDQGIKNPVKSHMVKRIEAVADAYLSNDRTAFVKSLVEQNLVSSSLMHKIAGREIAFETRIEKKEKKDE